MRTETHALLPKVVDLLVDTVCVVDAEGRYVFVSAACERLLGYTREELIGRKMIDLVYPEDRERTLEAAADIMHGQAKTNFENRYVRKDGRIVHIMWSARWSESDRIRMAVARDVTEVRRAARVQNALYRISEAAHTADGLFALYGHIHHIIADLLPAENFLVALYDEPSDTLSFPYLAGEHGRSPGPGAEPLGNGTALAEVIRSGRALLTGSRAAGSRAEADRKDWLGVPLISQDGVTGALAVQAYSGHVHYTEEDRDLLQFVSTQIAAAIERKRTETRLRHMARHDPLTDLPNRMLFHDRFDMALKRARRDNEYLALLYLDLDGFKEVNDNFGHELGDRLLREVAQRLVKCVRDSDTIGRMGGDEFTVLLANVHRPACAGIIADKIRAALGAPFDIQGHRLAISASIGAAVYPDDGEDIDRLFRRADADMYAAKRCGG